MITVRFHKKGDLLVGFDIRGHANYRRGKDDIVCASVSSAAYMTVNAVTDVLFCKANVSASDEGKMDFLLLDEDNRSALDMIKALEFHLSNLAKDYPKNLKVIFTTEV